MVDREPVYAFSSEKNHLLKQKRDISFEEIIAAIATDNLLDIVEHPNKVQYKDQKIYVVYAKNYVYLVPFVTDEDGNIFLKTIIPSRKAKQRYLNEEKDEKKQKVSSTQA